MIEDTNVDFGTKMQTIIFELSRLQFNINENFVLFLAALTEYHFEETMNLI